MLELKTGTPVIYISSFMRRSFPSFDHVTKWHVDTMTQIASSGDTNIALGWIESLDDTYARCRFLGYSRRDGWYLRTKANSEKCNREDLLGWDHAQGGRIETEFKAQIGDPLED